MKTLKKIKAFRFILILALVFSTFMGCKKDDSASGINSGGAYKAIPIIGTQGAMGVKLTDDFAIAGLAEVNVEIANLQVHYTDAKIGNDGWVSLGVEARVYNLLDLQHNATVILAENTHLPLGQISQVRMSFGTHNSVVVFDNEKRLLYPMIIATGPAADVNLNVVSKIRNDKNLVVVLSFNSATSVNNKEGTYIMHPSVEVKSISLGLDTE